jgi:electron-transferring-flavoprotein dehydrogenase
MAEREVLEFDVQWIGAGPAGLAGAIHLSNLIAKHDQAVQAGAPGKKLGEIAIAVLEKSATVGAHGISGAVMDPRAMRELLPDFLELGCPVEAEVTRDDVYMMWDQSQLKLPLVPPMLDNHGNYVLSLGNLAAWMAQIAEQKGVMVVTETPASSPIVESGRVVGVRTGDKGVNKLGQPKPNYQPGADCRAKATVLCEGPRGTIAKVLEKSLGLTVGRNAQVYSTGVKELWEMPAGRVQKGRVIHTMGFPLPHETFGGGFVYGLNDTHWSVGFVTGLDYRDPTTDPHRNLQRFKTHPLVRALIEGGKPVAYGAKAIPEGGYWAMPKLSADGVLLCGDTGGFLNGARLKGIHLAIKSGMLAAETLFECLLADDFGKDRLAGYEASFQTSWAAEELRTVRNFHQGFEHGLLPGLIHRVRGGARRTRSARRPVAQPAGARAHAARRRGPSERPARAGQVRRQAHLRQAGRRLLVGHEARRGSAGAPGRARHERLRDAMPHRVRQPLPALLPGQRLRDGAERRPRGPEAPDQRLELRALQDLRHRRSLSDHYLGHARRRRRPRLQESVGTP